MARRLTVPATGSTTHTAGSSPCRVIADAGRRMTSPSSISIRPVTVAPSRMSGGGSARPTLISKVRVLGSASAATSRTRPRPGCSAPRSGRLDLGLGRHGAEQLRRHVEDRVAAVPTRQPHDHLAGLHHLAGLGTGFGDHALGVGVELGEADLVSCEPDLSLGRLDLGAGGLPPLPGTLIDGAGREAALLELALALELVLGLGRLTLRGRGWLPPPAGRSAGPADRAGRSVARPPPDRRH